MIREMYRLENRALTEITVCRLVEEKIEGEKKGIEGGEEETNNNQNGALANNTKDQFVKM